MYIPSICSFYFSFIKRFIFERNFSNSALPDVKGQMASNIDAIMIALVSLHCPFKLLTLIGTALGLLDPRHINKIQN